MPGSNMPVWIVRIEESQPATREVSARPDEGFIAGVFKRATKISRWTRRADKVIRVGRTNALSRVRRPRKTSVRRQYAVDLPAAKRFADEVTTITEERQIPQTGNVQIVPHVKIRWTTFLAQVLWKRLICFRARTFVRQRVNTLGPTIENVKLKTAREATRQPCIHRVVVCVHVRRGNEYCKGEVVCRNHGLHEMLINEANQLVTRAALITDGADRL